VRGVYDPAGPLPCLRFRTTAFHLPRTGTASAPWTSQFRGSIPSPCVPLSTLRPPPHGCRRMTRGRRGLLGLRREALPSSPLRRSPGARLSCVEAFPLRVRPDPLARGACRPKDRQESWPCKRLAAAHGAGPFHSGHPRPPCAGSCWVGRPGANRTQLENLRASPTTNAASRTLSALVSSRWKTAPPTARSTLAKRERHRPHVQRSLEESATGRTFGSRSPGDGPVVFC
jgi:hypothetical protein